MHVSPRLGQLSKEARINCSTISRKINNGTINANSVSFKPRETAAPGAALSVGNGTYAASAAHRS